MSACSPSAVRTESVHSPAHEHESDVEFFFPCQLQLPDHWQGQYKNEKIGAKIHSTIDKGSYNPIDAVSGNTGIPELGEGPAAKAQSPEVAEYVTKDKEHEDPSTVPEFRIDPKKPKIKQENSEFV